MEQVAIDAVLGVMQITWEIITPLWVNNQPWFRINRQR